MAPDIIKLPPELIEHIFEFVPKANDRRRLAQTCWTFYRAVRRQSMRSNTLYLTKKASDKSHVRVFENSSMFPFSKLHVYLEAPAINQDRDFWLKHGHNITELTIENYFTLDWLSLFPNLKKLTVSVRYWFEQSESQEMKENAPKIQLPIEELCIGSGLTINEVCYILQSSPSLKSCELFVKKSEDLALLHPWIESIEKVKLNLDHDHFFRLNDILNIPSKVVFNTIYIYGHGPDIKPYINFFNIPRTIETVVLSFEPYQSEMCTREKLLQLLRAKSIKRLNIIGVPEFPNSLDLCAEIPGLETIDIIFYHNVILYPHYWSNPKTASIIRKIDFGYSYTVLENLSNLSSLTTLIGGKNYEHVQLDVVRNLLKLKKLVIYWLSNCDDAELEPISDLHDLEVLELKYANKITPVAFETIIRFPKLKKLVVEMKKITNSIVTSLAKNCPNLEELNLFEIKKDYKYFRKEDSESVEDDAHDAINDEGFEHLIRSLPYLKNIEIRTERRAISWGKREELKIEFPYLNIKINFFAEY